MNTLIATIPAQAGIQPSDDGAAEAWLPACAGATALRRPERW
jgi:hypothetical protein